MAKSTKERVRAHREKGLSPASKATLKMNRLLMAFPQFTGRIEEVYEKCLQEIPPKLRTRV
ncbi:MAG: hypothetical protein K0S58_1155 [Nitrospira sp.]|jgi:hypothetical protein|nr:hypothetical protein [Nitrospira sp.]